MGWNSWNTFGCDVSEDLIKNMTTAMIKSGMVDAGYTYMNLDDCVFVERDSNNRLVADPQRFPSGIAHLVDYVHSKGLKFGIYTDAGYKTCQGRPGLYGYEQIDADTFAGYGVDYLKVDWCHSEGMKAQDRYTMIGKALNATGRPIFYSMCEWGVDDPWKWSAPIANSWRMHGDSMIPSLIPSLPSLPLLTYSLTQTCPTQSLQAGRASVISLTTWKAFQNTQVQVHG
jgi:alpha-galactosidase